MKVKELIELLEVYNGESEVRNHENEDFVHINNLGNGDVTLSTKRPIGYCNRSGGYVYPTEVEDYVGVSAELDENVDWGEFTLPKKEEKEKFQEPIENKSKYKDAFLNCWKFLRVELQTATKKK